MKYSTRRYSTITNKDWILLITIIMYMYINNNGKLHVFEFYVNHNYTLCINEKRFSEKENCFQVNALWVWEYTTKKEQLIPILTNHLQD